MEKEGPSQRELEPKPENLSLADNLIHFAVAEKEKEKKLNPDTLIALTSLYTGKGETPDGQPVAQLARTIVQNHGGVAPEQEIPGQYLKAALILTVGRIENRSFQGTTHEVELLQAVASRMSEAANLMEDYPDAADLLSSLEQTAQNLGVEGGIIGLSEYVGELLQEHKRHQAEVELSYEEGYDAGRREQEKKDAELIEGFQEEIKGLKEQIKSERIARQQAEQRIQDAKQGTQEAEARAVIPETHDVQTPIKIENIPQNSPLAKFTPEELEKLTSFLFTIVNAALNHTGGSITHNEARVISPWFNYPDEKIQKTVERLMKNFSLERIEMYRRTSFDSYDNWLSAVGYYVLRGGGLEGRIGTSDNTTRNLAKEFMDLASKPARAEELIQENKEKKFLEEIEESGPLINGEK